jgi:tRNA(Ile)-lysidine synthase
MKQVLWPPPGRYVVAVSGGVDSTALLDLLVRHPQAKQWELVPAHFNHGWPGDDDYEQFARRAIEAHGLKPVVGQGQTKRSEAAARTARYEFLRRVMNETAAMAIITAHQQDDLEETVFLNIMRGTGRRGLSPFTHTPDVLRPLVGVRKAELKDYATECELEWCHDTYNDDLKFRRNYVRHEIIPRLEASKDWSHASMARVMTEAAELNQAAERQLGGMFKVHENKAAVSLELACRLELDVLTELIVAMVNAVRPGIELDRRAVVQLAVDLKSGRLRRRRSLANSLFAERQRDRVTIVFTP